MRYGDWLKGVAGVFVVVLGVLIAWKAFAQKMPFTTPKPDRTLIKELIVGQREIKENQKAILSLLRDIQDQLEMDDR